MSLNAQSGVYPPPSEYAQVSLLPATGGTVQAIMTPMLAPSTYEEVITATSNNQIAVYLSDGTRTFQAPATYPTAANPVALGAGNYRGVGRDDILVAQAGNNTLRYFLSNQSGSLGAYHDYPSGGTTPRSLLSIPSGIFVAHADRITFLSSANHFNTNDPALVLNPAQTVIVEPEARDLCYLDFDGQSIQVMDTLGGQLATVSNGEDLAFLAADGAVVIHNGNLTTRLAVGERVGGLAKVRNFLCLYLPDSNRVMRLAFGNLPGMSGQNFNITRRMPSGNDVSATLTYNYINLPAGASMVSSSYVDVNQNEDLIVNIPGSNSLAYYLELTTSNSPVPVTVALGATATRIDTGLFDSLDLNYDVVVQTNDGRMGVAFSGNPPIRVNTHVDEDNGTINSSAGGGAGTSLREALARAASVPGPNVIEIAASSPLMVTAVGEDSPTFGKSAFVITDDVTIVLSSTRDTENSGIEMVRSGGTAAMRLFRVATGGKLAISDSYFSNWTASNPTQSGGTILSDGDLVINRCTIEAGTSTVGGGAVACRAGSFLATNSTVSACSAPFLMSGGVSTLTHVTIAATSGSISPIVVSGGANVTLVNTLVAGYSASSGVQGALNPASHHNLVSAASTGLASLSRTGGNTPTIPLLPGSAAVNAGVVVAGVTTDQRELVRSGGAPDLGAYELIGSASFVESLVVSTATDEDNGTSDARYGTGTSLREAIAYALANPGADAVTFSPTVFGTPQTISLTLGQLSIPETVDDLVITGPQAGVTLDGNNASRILYNEFTSIFISRVTFARGFAAGGSDGGAILNYGPLTLTACTLRDNTASGKGGAIATYTYLSLGNCTVTRNTAANGGGIFGEFSASLDFWFTTIAGNTATAGIGGVAKSGSKFINLCILSGNTGSPQSNANTDINQYAFNSVINVADPKLGPLADNGGPNQTMALLPGSPAVGKGTSAGAYPTDQRGVARDLNPDAGAFEFTALSPSLVVTTASDEADGTSDPGFGTGTSLREALAYATSLGGVQTITFSPSLVGETLMLTRTLGDGNAMAVTTSITIQGPSGGGGVTLQPGSIFGPQRHFYVAGGASLTLQNLTLRGGRSGFGGAVYSFGTFIARNCTFTDNIATSEGGAVHSTGASTALTLENCTFVGNSTDGYGSAIVTGAPTNTFSHLTVTANIGPNGPLWIYQTTVLLRNSMLAGNVPDGVALVAPASFAPESTHNLIGPGNSAGILNGVSNNLVGLSASALQLAALANNGGPTQTFALLPTSPALNAGVAIAGITTDQRGLARSVGGAPDIGALEDSIGNGDPDRDSLGNFAELALGSNPSSIDSDNDGYNDATEQLANRNPNNGESFPGATRIERVLGFGPACGLDLSGNFVYAFNVGPAGAAGQAGDANFTADNASGITVHAPNNPIAVWNNPDFGANLNDNSLELVYQSIRWADRYWSAPDKNLRVDLANLTVGRKYKLQLLFGEAGSTGRRFDVVVNGALVVNDFAPSDAQGAAYMAKAGSAVVHEFTATSSTLNIVLDGTNVAAVANLNQDPYLNGATLEDITPPTALDTWRSLHGLAANGSQDLANPSGDGVANLLKFAFNLAGNPGDLSHPNVVVLAENGSSGLPCISRDGSGRLVVEFVRRKVSSNSGIVYEVQTGEQLTGLFPLSLDSATITSIDADWERVRLADPAGTSKRFGRVKVTATP